MDTWLETTRRFFDSLRRRGKIPFDCYEFCDLAEEYSKDQRGRPNKFANPQKKAEVFAFYDSVLEELGPTKATRQTAKEFKADPRTIQSMIERGTTSIWLLFFALFMWILVCKR
jgi:hypothetical protein